MGDHEPTGYHSSDLGETKLVHIVPSGAPVLSRPFIAQVRRCDESLLKIGNLEGLLQARGIHQLRSEVSAQGYCDLYRLWKEQYERSGAHPSNILNDIVQEVDHAWAYYQDLTKRS